MKLVWASVDEVLKTPERERRLFELAVTTDDGHQGRAIAYERLVGSVVVGNRVLLNTTAVDLNLGTGGFSFVVACAPSQEVPRGVVFDMPASQGGHIMKLRYSPLQLDVLSVEEDASPAHSLMKEADSLDGMPVVCCGLHSQVPVVAAAIKAHNSELKVGYAMTDQAALAAELSDLLARSKDAGLIDTCITTGQAFGGELEAVSLHSGLLALKHVEACDIAIVAIGPGVVGTGTPFGHGGIAQGEALNAVVSLSGTPIAVLRMSLADERPRHRGVSHHSTVALSKIALASVTVAYPELKSSGYDEALLSFVALKDACQKSTPSREHHFVCVEESSFNPAALRGLTVRSMRRGYEDDPLFFEAAWAAGYCAARLSH